MVFTGKDLYADDRAALQKMADDAVAAGGEVGILKAAIMLLTFEELKRSYYDAGRFGWLRFQGKDGERLVR